jgi:hypothetical protein
MRNDEEHQPKEPAENPERAEKAYGLLSSPGGLER